MLASFRYNLNVLVQGGSQHDYITLPKYVLNCRSLVNKLSSLYQFVCGSAVDILCLSDTWLSDYTFDSEVLPMVYALYRRDRPIKGGRVLVAVRDTSSSWSVSSPSHLEAVTVGI